MQGKALACLTPLGRGPCGGEVWGGGLKVCVGGLVRKRKCFLSLSKERLLSLKEEDVIDPYLLPCQQQVGLHIKIFIGFVKPHGALHITSGLPCSTSPCTHCQSGHSKY